MVKNSDHKNMTTEDVSAGRVQTNGLAFVAPKDDKLCCLKQTKKELLLKLLKQLDNAKENKKHG